MRSDKISTEPVFGEKIENVNYENRNAVYGIAFDQNGCIATIKTPNGYFLPGGGVQKGENYLECLKRELLEETGHKIEIQSYVGRASLYHTTINGKHKIGIGHFYRMNLKEKVKEKIEKDHELVWLEPFQCVRRLFLEHQAWAVFEAMRKR